jgi:hypothetical protein
VRRLALLPALALAACATLPPAIPESASCQANFLGFDRKVAAADAVNGGAYRIPGFPYLRSDRFLASFRGEVEDEARFAAWVERLRQLDLASRAAELRNVGWDPPAEELAHLDRCGSDWARRDLADPARRAQLVERAAVPDDYSLLKRTLGLYPVAVPFLNLGIRGFNEDVLADYATPAAQLEAPGRLVLWQGRSPRVVSERPARPDRDALGIEAPPADWLALAKAYQPTWLIETDGAFDEPGAVQLGEAAPTVDVARPVTYFLPAYTRFGDKVLTQLVYVVWFSERPREGRVDFYAGKLDGVIWRVTLDTDGRPLLYDTIHSCGCYHYYFRAKPLQRKPQGGFWDEPVLFPQEAPKGPFAIRIQARNHYVRRLVPLAGLGAIEQRDYALARYEDLLSLPDPEGGTRSLFCEDGLVCGSERLERFYLWPAGIDSAGAMRQWGRHPTSFVGRTHFDDPGMLDRLFEPPSF